MNLRGLQRGTQRYFIDCTTTLFLHHNCRKRRTTTSSRCARPTVHFFQVEILTPVVGGYHSCVGGRGQQKRGQVEHSASERQEPKQCRQNVAVYGADPEPCTRHRSKLIVFTTQMLAAIGETFDPLLSNPDAETPSQSLITGVIVSTRPQFYRLSIWTRIAPTGAGGDDDKLRERIESVGRHFKMNVLGYSDSQKLSGPLATEVEFQSHKDSEKKGKQSGRKIVV